MYTFIFDIGKTNVKGHVLDADGRPVWSRSTPNQPLSGKEYVYFDVDGIWDWLQSTLREAAQEFSLGCINVSTHGACAVLLDRLGEVVLPVLDYEFDELDVANGNYDELRPDFAKTFSPQLGAGLNLGRQLWYLKSRFPDAFCKVDAVLMYPQYWVYKLSGVQVSEVTSLGCHTDLWDTSAGCYSSLVDVLDIRHCLPPLCSATTSVGAILPSLAVSLGLPESCQVYVGVHDSNAGFARYLAADIPRDFTVMSTGTWVVAMTNNGQTDQLVETEDMLANVNVMGEPIACARFMGGREFEELCRLGGATPETPFSALDLQQVIDTNVFALPPVITGSGPLCGVAEPGGIIGTAQSGSALATLYLALMMDYQLDALRSSGAILFGSAALKNPLLCRMLAQLRPHQVVMMAKDSASTLRGAWCLTRWGVELPDDFARFDRAPSLELSNVTHHRDQWRLRSGLKAWSSSSIN